MSSPLPPIPNYFFFSLPYFSNPFSAVFAMALPSQSLVLPLRSPGGAPTSQHPPPRNKEINPRGGFSFRARVRCFSNTREWKREQKDSGKVQNRERTKTRVSFNKSVATSRRKSGHRTLIYLLLRQHCCCKAQILIKWPFPHLPPSNPTTSRPKWNQRGESLKIVGLHLLPAAGFALLVHATFSTGGCTNWGLTKENPSKSVWSMLAMTS